MSKLTLALTMLFTTVLLMNLHRV
ncbi:hypothetical protein Godav_028957 [Gossypium davidsonii]|uniref:Uncharacterized protein n=1 Tax=Gossypium davidsonii TaxID=34287 RepID=A0A7J8T948_GOSDV|nr:hypothetical protein [Gossypium davidsonii]